MEKNGWVVCLCVCVSVLRSILSALNYHSSTVHVCVCVFNPVSFLMCVAAG